MVVSRFHDEQMVGLLRDEELSGRRKQGGPSWPRVTLVGTVGTRCGNRIRPVSAKPAATCRSPSGIRTRGGSGVSAWGTRTANAKRPSWCRSGSLVPFGTCSTPVRSTA